MSVWEGDTPWEQEGTGTVGTLTDPGEGSAGAVTLTTSTTDERVWLRKEYRSMSWPEDQLFWLSSRLRVDDTALNVVFGIANLNVIELGAPAASDAGVWAAYDGPTTSWGIAATDSITTSVTTTGESLTVDTWAWVDVVIAAGAWAALWVDGSGPYVVESNVPPTTDEGGALFIGATPSSNSALELAVDCVTCQIVDAANNPADFALSGGFDLF